MRCAHANEPCFRPRQWYDYTYQGEVSHDENYTYAYWLEPQNEGNLHASAGATVTYVLPAPSGHYVEGAFQCAAVMAMVKDDASCEVSCYELQCGGAEQPTERTAPKVERQKMDAGIGVGEVEIEL